jgi:predicted RNase H-like HicB family nuclease
MISALLRMVSRKPMYYVSNYVKLQTILWKEDDIYVIKEAITDVTTQGNTVEEALTNLKVVSLYVNEVPETRELITKTTAIDALSVEIT